MIPDIPCEDCRRSVEQEPILGAEGFTVRADWDGPQGPLRTRLHATCRRHRPKHMNRQWVELEDGWRDYVVQEVMDP